MKVVIFLMSIFLQACNYNEYICIGAVSEGFVVTEDIAIDVTKRTLEKNGIDTSNMIPVPYWQNDNRIFARNEHSPNNGYVLWHDKRNIKTLYEYSVSIERKDDHFLCKTKSID